MDERYLSNSYEEEFDGYDDNDDAIDNSDMYFMMKIFVSD